MIYEPNTPQIMGIVNVTPDSFTHGSAEQRVRWFRRGFSSGQLDTCDTFATTSL